MPRTVAKLPSIAVAARSSVEDGAYLRERTRVVAAVNRAVRALVRDARRICGPLDRIAQAPGAEAARRGKDGGQYVAHVLSARAPELIAEAREESTARGRRTGGGR